MTNSLIRLCAKLCSKSNHHSHQVSCIVTRKRRIISTGYNSLKTHPSALSPFYSSHAEFNALHKLSPEQLKGAIVYIFRQKADGSLGNSRPCKHCYAFLKAKNITKIVYSHEDGFKTELVI